MTPIGKANSFDSEPMQIANTLLRNTYLVPKSNHMTNEMKLQECILTLHNQFGNFFLLLSLFFINQLAFGAGIMINHCKKRHMDGSLGFSKN